MRTEQHRTGKQLGTSDDDASDGEEDEDRKSIVQGKENGRKKTEGGAKKFGKAKEEEEGPGFVERLKLWLGIEKGEGWGKAAWPILEKGASVVSKLPEPSLLFLMIVWALMIVRILRRSVLESWIVVLGTIAAMSGVIVMSFVWGKTDLFARLREGQYQTKGHPEEKLDVLEADIKEREAQVKIAGAELKKNRKQLELLKKELDLDPEKDDEQRVVKPSQKAVEIIAKGALGTDYGAEDAEAAELRKKKEAVVKSREAWKMRTAEMEDSGVKNKIREHTATVYKKRTKQLKSNANVQKTGGVLAVAGGLRLPFANKEKGNNHNNHESSSQPHPILDVPSSTSLLQPMQQQNGIEEPVEDESHSAPKLKKRRSGLKKILSFGSRRNSHANNHRRDSESLSVTPAAA